MPEGDLRDAVDLVHLAHELGFPCVGVAVHPEGHPVAESHEADRTHQAAKLREADFGLTQFFHAADDYFTLVEDLAKRSADARIIPGVMPITNLRQVERMAAMSGTNIPKELARRLQAVADQPDEVRRLVVRVIRLRDIHRERPHIDRCALDPFPEGQTAKCSGCRAFGGEAWHGAEPRAVPASF